MMELATPMMKRNDPLNAAPVHVISGLAMRLPIFVVRNGHTDDSSHMTHTIQFTVDIRANSNGRVLKHRIRVVHVALEMIAYHNDDDGTVTERKVQTTGNGKLAHIDQPPGRIIDRTWEEW